MKKQVGLWIDHKEAVIVTLTGEAEETRHMVSGMESHVRFSDNSDSPGSRAEDMRDKRFTKHLDSYYDGVITSIRDAEAIWIMGPGEAKSEIKKRLERQGLGGRILGTDTVDKLSDHQIAALVRQHFGK